MNMKNTETPFRPLAEVRPQERLAYAWAVAQSAAYRAPTVSEALLARCREAAEQLADSDCWQLLSEVPTLGAA